MEVIVANAIVVDSSVFWAVCGGMVALSALVISFEVGRLFRLVAAVREVKEEIADVRRVQETMNETLTRMEVKNGN